MARAFVPVFLMVLPAALLVAACGAPPLAPRPLAGQLGAAALSGPEGIAVAQASTIARAAVADADATYAELGLDTAHGRKLTPARQPVIRDGLLPLSRRLDASADQVASTLESAPGAKVAYLLRELARRRPAPAAPDAGAEDLLYRVARHRIALGFVIEYALRKRAGAPAPAPTPPGAPSPLPTAGIQIVVASTPPTTASITVSAWFRKKLT